MEWLHTIIGTAGEQISLPQMLARATLVFFVGVALVRVTMSRLFSKATPLDIILSVIIGSNLSRTLTGNAPFEEVIATTVALVALHAALAHLAARSRTVANLVKGKPRVLVEDGVVDEKAMKAEAIGERDLQTAIRNAGGTEVDEVQVATIERGGNIEVVLKG